MNLKNLKTFSFTVDVSQEDGCMLGVEKLLCYPKYIECLEVEVDYRITTYFAQTYFEPEEPKQVEVYRIEVRSVWDLWSWDTQGSGNWSVSDKQKWMLSELVEAHFMEKIEEACWEVEVKEKKQVNAFRCSEFGALI